jgi:hypothetical protein
MPETYCADADRNLVAPCDSSTAYTDAIAADLKVATEPSLSVDSLESPRPDFDPSNSRTETAQFFGLADFSLSSAAGSFSRTVTICPPLCVMKYSTCRLTVAPSLSADNLKSPR